jgi:hypothetical protein
MLKGVPSAFQEGLDRFTLFWCIASVRQCYDRHGPALSRDICRSRDALDRIAYNAQLAVAAENIEKVVRLVADPWMLCVTQLAARSPGAAAKLKAPNPKQSSFRHSNGQNNCDLLFPDPPVWIAA